VFCADAGATKPEMTNKKQMTPHINFNIVIASKEKFSLRDILTNIPEMPLMFFLNLP